MNRLFRSGPVVGALLALGGAACQPDSAVDVGRQLFADPRLSRSEFNAVSCATCHDDGSDEVEVRILPGAPLVDSVFRPAWWGGAAPTLKDAVDHCLVFFMREQPLEPTAPASRALYEYLLSISPSPAAPAVPMTVVENITDLPRGDPTRGARVYTAACASCHGDAFTGAGRPSELYSIVPGDSEDFAASSGFPLTTVIVEKVRHGAFFGIGGTMPPFSLESLSDEDLGALLGYLVPVE
jgi:thiosulfate dehydrogenase